MQINQQLNAQTAYKTVVITGASSGIGLATALAFAREKANLVLAARRKENLEEVAAKCRELGAQAIAVPTDVTDFESVKSLAAQAVEHFHTIDIWINNAGTGAVGNYDDVPMEAHKKVLDVNLLGYMHGAHAALPYFKRQQTGTLINNISLGAWAPIPYASSYSATKFGLHGFTRALRGELRPYADIHICSVYPGMIDTPAFERSGNYSGKKISPFPPVYAPERVAKAMLAIAREPRSETVVGKEVWLHRFGQAVAPQVLAAASEWFIKRALAHADSWPVTDGELFTPTRKESRIDGGARKRLGMGGLKVVAASVALFSTAFITTRAVRNVLS